MGHPEEARPEEADDEEATHRLHDIHVLEISLVDRPANRRKFVVVKRGSEMDKYKTDAGVEVEVNDDGELVVDTTKEGETAPEAPEAPAAEPEPEPAPEPTMKMPASLQEKVLRVIATALKDLTSVAGAVKAAEATDDEAEDAPVPEAVASALKHVQATLEEVTATCAPEHDGQSEEEDEEEEPAEKSGEEAPSEEPADDDENDVEKRAKVSAKQIRDAAKAASKLGELLVEFKRVFEDNGLVDVLKTAKGSQEEVPTPSPEEDGQLKELAGHVRRLTSLVKKQASEIDQLRSSPASSNSIPPDATVERRKPFVWPFDLNEG